MPPTMLEVGGQMAKAVGKQTRSQRAKKQAELLLTHLKKSGSLKTGHIIHCDLKQLYQTEILKFDSTLPYFYVFQAILHKSLLLPKLSEESSLVRFNVPKVEKFLQRCMISSFSTLSLSEDNGTPHLINLTGNVSPRTEPISQPGSAASNQKFKLPQHSNTNCVPYEPTVASTQLGAREQILRMFSKSPSTNNSSFATSKDSNRPNNNASAGIIHSTIVPSKSTSPSAKSPSSPNGASISKHSPNSSSPKSFPSNSTLKNLSDAAEKLPNGEKSSPNSSLTSNKGRDLFVDQRYAFKLHEPQRKVPPPVEDEMECDVCKETFGQKEQMLEHKATDEHLFRDIYQNCRHVTSMEKTKPPRAVSGEAQGIVIQSAEGTEGNETLKVNLYLTEDDLYLEQTVSKNIQLTVTYNPPNKNTKPLYLDRIFLILSSPSVLLLEKNAPRQTVRKGKQIKRNIKITEKTVGSTDYIIVFKFLIGSGSEEKLFFVMKKVCVRVDNDATKEEGLPVFSTPSVKAQPEPLITAEPLQNFITSMPKVVEEAEPPPKPYRQLTFTRKLDDYDLPSVYSRFFNFGFQSNANITPDMMRQKYDILKTLVEGVTRDNYDHFFSLLLYLEEHQVLCDLRTYSMKDTPLFRDKLSRKLITITVPGLAEDRPSVLKGDCIYITLAGSGTFKGWVHRVANTELYVGMGPKFMKNFINNTKATVDFSFNRMCLKMQHRALEILMQSNQVPKICFPLTCGARTIEKPIKSWINRLVSKNPQQRQAVQNIINGTSLPAPYLLFGPPGTGKTITLVETIKQIFKQSERTYILATAPSNSASDLLAERVLESLPPSQVLRLYSPSRDWSNVPATLHRSSNFYSGECVFPCLEELKKYRVIVATLICAGRLVSGGFPVGHFSHIFVDECGHGMEPTALVPIAGLLSPEPNPGQLVLSGDPKQLGPIIRSPVAKSLGLTQSLLERLMDSCALYQKQEGHYNPKVLTKLVKNFRSHPDILKVPNELFYEGDLEPCGEVGVTHSACQWEELPTKGVPLIFHGIEGKDAQDDCSPSFYNIAEVNLVVSYVQKILDAKFCGQKLRPADIGIISPYRRQIVKLHRALERKQLTGLSVGSVEEFQGQERRVIIVSTVRSDPAQLSLDRKFRLGFLREPKRFNVALTRAKSLLIVIGNPNILQTDPNWYRLLEWAVVRGGYTGCKFSLTHSPSFGPVAELQGEKRVPERLRQQLALTKQALELQGGEKDRWRSSRDVDTLMEEIKKLSFLSEVSELESVVSPPFTIMEQ